MNLSTIGLYLCRTILIIKYTINRSRRGTVNGQQSTVNSQQSTVNSQQSTANSQQPTANQVGV
ncbi:MAG: hypothetical protein PT119_06905 [Aphanizomenon gracile PMC627.10]|nr:hypothetical protein [Aphanizomenon gracile PMC627.10]